MTNVSVGSEGGSGSHLMLMRVDSLAAILVKPMLLNERRDCGGTQDDTRQDQVCEDQRTGADFG